MLQAAPKLPGEAVQEVEMLTEATYVFGVPVSGITDSSTVLELSSGGNLGSLQNRIDDLEAKIDELIDRLDERPQPFVTFVSSLGVEGLSVKKPIPVTLRPDGDTYIASFFDANISTSGDTAEEAIANLQSLVSDVFDLHEEEAEKKTPLGPAMKKQRQVLMESICRVLRNPTPRPSLRS